MPSIYTSHCNFKSCRLQFPSPRSLTSSRSRIKRLSCHAVSSTPPTPRYNNLIGVHALVWCGGWSKQETLLAAEGCRASGYDLIEIPAFDAHLLDASTTKSILEENNLRASTSLGLTFDADINSEDPEIVEKGKQTLMSALDFTHKIGGRYMCGVTYSALGKYPGPCTPLARKNCLGAMKDVAAKAADYGITVGLEVVNRYETNLLNTAAQGMEFLMDLDAANVGLHLDTYHMNIEENSMEQAIHTCWDKLAYVHIGESHRGYLGTGTVDFPAVFNALASIGYQGPITFESFSSAIVSKDLSTNLCVWRNLWKDSHDLAQHARQYIETNWTAAIIAAKGP